MKNLKLIGITILLLLTMTACGSGSPNKSESERDTDKVSDKSKLPYDSDIQEMFDNKQGLVTFRPDSSQSIDYFVNHLKIKDYRLHSYSARFGGSSSSKDEAKFYYVTYEYVGWNAK